MKLRSRFDHIDAHEMFDSWLVTQLTMKVSFELHSPSSELIDLQHRSSSPSELNSDSIRTLIKHGKEKRLFIRRHFKYSFLDSKL